VVGPLLATALVAWHLPLREVFAIAVIPGVIATALVFAVREPARVSSPAQSGAQPGAPPAAGVLTPTLLSYLIVLALFSLGNSSDGFLLLRARSVGLPTAEIPVLWAVLNASKVVWAWLGGDMADRIPRARLIAIGWLVYALVYLGLGQATARWEVWGLFVVYGVFYGLTEPVEKALLKDLVRADQRGRAYGAYNFVVGITALPAGLITGLLWRTWGPGPALELSAVLAGAAAVALLGWDAWRRRSGDGGPSGDGARSGAGRPGGEGPPGR
jgi:MFS family permease